MSKIDLVIFGATGDLSARKLFPALFHLDMSGLLTSDLRIAAVARQEQDSSAFQIELRSKMAGYMRHEIDDDAWQKFSSRIVYLCLLYTSPSPRDKRQSRMPSSA